VIDDRKHLPHYLSDMVTSVEQQLGHARLTIAGS
jgi:hypothetical protein